MASDIYTSSNVENLLKRRGVLLIGDSNIRCLYKDLVYLITEDAMTPVKSFRGGGVDKSFHGDRIIRMAKNSGGRDFYEAREFQVGDLQINFMFVTRAYAPQVRDALEDIREGRQASPQIVIMNSFLWDLTRWGPMKEDQYKEDMVKLFKDLKRSLPEDVLVIWLTTLPVATERVKGGVFIKQVDFVKHSMRYWILEANKFAQQLCMAYDFNVLDLHYYMRFELNRRANDGIHWEPVAVRYMTNIILTHIALSLSEPLPGNFQSQTLHRVQKDCKKAGEPNEILLGKDVLDMIEQIDLDQPMSRVTKKARRRNVCIQERAESSSRSQRNHEDRSRGRYSNEDHSHREYIDNFSREDVRVSTRSQISLQPEPVYNYQSSNQTSNASHLLGQFQDGYTYEQCYNNSIGHQVNHPMLNPDVYSRLEMPSGRQRNANFQVSGRQGLYSNNFYSQLSYSGLSIWQDPQTGAYRWYNNNY